MRSGVLLHLILLRVCVRRFPSSFFVFCAADGADLPSGFDRLVFAQRSLGSGHLLAGQQPVHHCIFLRHQGIRESRTRHDFLCFLDFRVHVPSRLRVVTIEDNKSLLLERFREFVMEK